MDGPLIENSDSDSGESWTLLDSNPAFADEAPEFAEAPIESPVSDSHEKDDDTDGISIISDSDRDTHSPYEINIEKYSEEIRPKELDIAQYISVNPHLPNFNTDESLGADDLLGDNNKHKIYVHKRNKRLSAVLNIIVLGSVITAAGVAIGHMWGAKNDCSLHVPPSVNKILSNLYKLQEENAYLRNKLKELSQYHQIQQKLPLKHNKCKKTFEESLNNNNVNRFTKCVDDINKLESHFVEPSFERDFVADVNKLENIYKENKSWLDEDIVHRLKVEKNMWNNNVQKLFKSHNLNKQNKPVDVQKVNKSSKINQNTLIQDNSLKRPIMKVSYADSLISDKLGDRLIKRDRAFENDLTSVQNKKLKNKESLEHVVSDVELKKDDRYIENKIKQERKKLNRQKSFKKQKRRNKYEQWEMKGGFIRDFDDMSTSSLDDPIIYEHKSTITDAKINDNPNVFNETKINKSSSNKQTQKRKIQNQKNWYDKRVELRKEARQKLEQEMFGIGPNTARWYFKRMQKREQCRTKDNSTNRKLNYKRDMNYKTKH